MNRIMVNLVAIIILILFFPVLIVKSIVEKTLQSKVAWSRE